MDLPDTQELHQLLFDTIQQNFSRDPFRRDDLINLTQRRGLSLGWWLTETDRPFAGLTRKTKGSAAMIAEVFADFVRRGILIQVKEDRWRLTRFEPGNAA